MFWHRYWIFFAVGEIWTPTHSARRDLSPTLVAIEPSSMVVKFLYLVATSLLLTDTLTVYLFHGWWWWRSQGNWNGAFTTCLSHPKVVKYEEYRGAAADIKFMKFWLQSASILEELLINSKYLGDIRAMFEIELLMSPKGSSHVSIMFFWHCYSLLY